MPHFATLTLTIPLKCACGSMTITHRAEFSPEKGVEEAALFATHGAKSLAHWAADRIPRHRCELVTQDNPNGIAPRDRAAP